MVNQIRFFIWMIVGFFIFNTAQAGVSLSKTKLMLGESLILVVTGKNVENDFMHVDKPGIKKHFEIYNVEGDSERMRLVLYPRKAGVWVFPALNSGGIHSKPIKVTVTKNPEVEVTWHQPPTQVYQNQVITWQASVHLNNSANTATLTAHPHFNHKVKHWVPKRPVQETTSIMGKTQHLMLADATDQLGRIKLRSPVISVKNETSRAWLFFDEIKWIQVKPLPSYLPVGTPIGKISLKPTEGTSFWTETGRLNRWQLTQIGQNILPTKLPSLIPQLGSSTAIEWLAPVTQQKIQWHASGLQGVKIIDIPYRINHFGFYQLPSIRMTYFDPQAGILKDTLLPAQYGFSVPAWLLTLLKLIGFAWVIFVVVVIFKLIKWMWLKRQLKNAILASESPLALWEVLKAWQVKINPKANPIKTIAQWQESLKSQNVSHETFQLAQSLNQQLFCTKNPQAWVELQKQAFDWANQISIYSLLVNEWRTARHFLKAMLKA